MGTKPNTTNDSRTGLSWATLKLTDVYASYQPIRVIPGRNPNDS